MLTIDDLVAAVPGLHKSEILGKEVWIRELNFDDTMRFAQSELSEIDQAKEMAALSLCDEDGGLLFESAAQASELLGRMPTQATLEILNAIKEVNGLDEEVEQEKLEAVPLRMSESK